MKIFHLGDLHFGKTLGEISLQEDQAYWIDRLLDKADEEKPDAVLIAGDVYDRANPGPEAMQLYEKLLYGLAERKIWTLIIPGNHDSAVRLSCTSDLLKDNRVYIAGPLSKELMHVTIQDDNGFDVTFWMMPYIYPSLVEAPEVLDRDDLNCYDAAARALLAEQSIDPTACNVLIAHQNVLAGGKKPEHSESETIIGGLGEIDYSAFDTFDYVALGHIHHAQCIGRESVRYSGCPLYYDFSEVNREKKLTVVSIQDKNHISVKQLEIPILHQLLQPKGTLQEVLDYGRGLDHKEKYYIQIILKNKDLPMNAAEQIRGVYGSQIDIKPDFDSSDFTSGVGKTGISEAEKPIDQQFAMFYQRMQNQLLSETQDQVLKKVLEQQERSEIRYSNVDKIPEQDSDELLDTLLKLTEVNE